AVAALARLHRSKGTGPSGSVVGRIPDGVYRYAVAHVLRGDGGSTRREYDECLRRHSLGLWSRASVPVRGHAEPHLQVDLGGTATLHRELAALLAQQRHHAAVHHVE